MFTLIESNKNYDTFDQLLKKNYDYMKNDKVYKITYKDIDIFIEKHQEKVTKLKFFKGYVLKSIKGYYRDIKSSGSDIKKFFDNKDIVYKNGYIQYDKDIEYNFIY
jgi:hypothetical protein